LHPELFVIHQTRTIERGDYQATISITSAGHMVQWRYQGLTLTEVAAAAHHPLPQRRRLMAHRLQGNRSDRLECCGGIEYEMKFSLEPADNKKFMAYQKELTLQATRKGMLQQFKACGRLEMGALSYINMESRDKTFHVQAFNTFPEDCALLKIQSWFRLP